MTDDRRTDPLHERDVDPDPLRQFAAWFADARAAGIRAPEAMALATATRDGHPSARIVLLKSFDEHGFGWHTGYESRKARDLRATGRAALLFHWDPLGRQVRIEGSVEQVPREESEAYFRTRPRGSQLAALASRQSEPVPSREALDAAYAEAVAAHEGRDVELPPHWGGFRLVPETYEFWQHRENRLHDRLRYRREGGEWRLDRLFP